MVGISSNHGHTLIMPPPATLLLYNRRHVLLPFFSPSCSFSFRAGSLSDCTSLLQCLRSCSKVQDSQLPPRRKDQAPNKQSVSLGRTVGMVHESTTDKTFNLNLRSVQEAWFCSWPARAVEDTSGPPPGRAINPLLFRRSRILTGIKQALKYWISKARSS